MLRCAPQHSVNAARYSVRDRPGSIQCRNRGARKGGDRGQSGGRYPLLSRAKRPGGPCGSSRQPWPSALSPAWPPHPFGFSSISRAILGVVAGLAGVAYNRGIMASLYWMDGNRLPWEIRAGIIGALVGALAYWWPTIVGGGEHLTQEALLGRGGLAAVLAVLACRIVLGIASYAAATPGVCSLPCS